MNVYRFDETLTEMIEGAQKTGFITYQQVDAYLPDEGGDPRMVDDLILVLDRLGINLINDPDAIDEEEELLEAEAEAKKEQQEVAAALKPLIGPETTLSSRDPIRMYLSQMGNIPLLTRAKEIFLAKTIEITRKRFRRTTMQSDFARRRSRSTCSKKSPPANCRSSERCERRTRQEGTDRRPDAD